MFLYAFVVAVCLANAAARSVSNATAHDQMSYGSPEDNSRTVTDLDSAVTGPSNAGCNCKGGYCEKGTSVCKCYEGFGIVPNWTPKECKKCDCRKEFGCTFYVSLNSISGKKCLCPDGFQDIKGECIGTCKKNPCQNGGECKVKEQDIECKCKEPFTGDLCNENVNSCEKNDDCTDGKVCKNLLCSCEEGYGGFGCKDVLGCDQLKDTCENAGASCVFGTPNKPVCQCNGQGLVFRDNECVDVNSCQMNDDCTDGKVCKNLLCSCEEGYGGAECKEILGCDQLMDTCENADATCVFGTPNNPVCQCNHQGLVFKYNACLDPNSCEKNDDCTDGKVCKNLLCSCEEGYGGLGCKEILGCDKLKNTCENADASCVFGTPNNPVCQCNSQGLVFRDNECVDPDSCEKDDDCTDGKICKNLLCTCEEGYGGVGCKEILGCEQMKDICDKANAVCVFGTPNNPECQCNESGYVFKNNECLHQCSPNPCRNNGLCSVKNGTVICSCKEPYIGNYCEEDGCASNPCRYGGTCSVQKGKVICSCRGNYGGDRCEKYLCHPDPCNDQGICVIKDGKQTCVCNQPYTGDNCEINVCHPESCNKRGKCIERNGQQTCECEDPYTGDNCEINICEVNPCVHGVCTGKTGKPTCVCPDNYLGDRCEIVLCDPNPCENGGICKVTDWRRIHCDCVHPYQGEWCEKDPCNPNPCQNGGLCWVDRWMDRYCKCMRPYRGRFCETAIMETTENTLTTIIKDWNTTKELRTTITGVVTSDLITGTSTETSKPSTLTTETYDETSVSMVELSTADSKTTVVESSSEASSTVPETPPTSREPCFPNPCRNGGMCKTEGGEILCFCVAPFTGKHCEMDLCMLNPCKNGGICKFESNATKCFCTEPFTGEFCDSHAVTSADFILFAILTSLVLIVLIFVIGVLSRRIHVLKNR